MSLRVSSYNHTLWLKAADNANSSIQTLQEWRTKPSNHVKTPAAKVLAKGKEDTECIGEEGSSKPHLQLGDFILGYFFLVIVLYKKTILWLSSTSYFLMQLKIHGFTSPYLSTVYFLSYYLSYGILMVRVNILIQRLHLLFWGRYQYSLRCE